MTYLDSALLDIAERVCRRFQLLTGRTNVWLAVQLTNLSIIVYFVWAAAYFVYQGLQWATGMPLQFTTMRVLTVFAASVAMCAIAALVAVREAQRADPAEVF